ncbi:FAD-dependent oxidoreductase [Chloroflexota bacterium]
MADITLSINGKQVTVAGGNTVLEAAQTAGIYIPTLCYHPALKPYGGCRLCLVEIEKTRGPVTACTTPAADGMVVQTETELLTEIRRGILELVLSEHPHQCLTCSRRERCQPDDVCLRNVAVTERCVTCAKNGKCDLQKVADYIGIAEVTIPYTYRGLPVDNSDPLFVRDYNLCILCGRCVQMCQEVRGIGAISFLARGSDAVVGTAFDRPLSEAQCRYCGACVEVCPTGALTDKQATEEPELTPEEVAVPCQNACPAGINVPLYVYLAGEGKFGDSLAVVREKVPFPGVLGRVCIHPCEEACRRGRLNDSISIKFVKRFVSDRDSGAWQERSRQLTSTGKKVAVIGAGPSGLTAGYYLAKAGHGVTVFEQYSKAGGMMRVGIPDYRLPPEVLDGEIDVIKKAGVEIKLNNRVESMDWLFEQGYDAVYVAIGCHEGMKMGLEGEDLPGVLDGATFLRDANLGVKVNVGGRVAVVGGGNVAIDSARIALRLGAKDVRILYRRTRAEMPASAEEVEAALHEGINIDLLVAPLSVRESGSKLVLHSQRMELGEPDASGRRRPVPVAGSEFDEEYTAIIGAIGQRTEASDGFGLKTNRNRTFSVNDSLAASRQGVWAGGDAVIGPASVIQSIAAGRQAASAIDKYLGGDGQIEEELTPIRELDMTCSGMPGSFSSLERVAMPELAPEERKGSIEVELGFTEGGAVVEAKRCFQCGVRCQIPVAPTPPPGSPNRTRELLTEAGIE